jgi:hypothetical protein
MIISPTSQASAKERLEEAGHLFDVGLIAEVEFQVSRQAKANYWQFPKRAAPKSRLCALARAV